MLHVKAKCLLSIICSGATTYFPDNFSACRFQYTSKNKTKILMKKDNEPELYFIKICSIKAHGLYRNLQLLSTMYMKKTCISRGSVIKKVIPLKINVYFFFIKTRIEVISRVSMIVAFQSVFIYSDFAHHQYFVFFASQSSPCLKIGAKSMYSRLLLIATEWSLGVLT